MGVCVVFLMLCGGIVCSYDSLELGVIYDISVINFVLEILYGGVSYGC